jgi:hypothetical protein
LVGAIVVVSAILTSTVRSAWVILGIGVVTFAMLRGGQTAGRTLAVAAIAVCALLLARTQVPGVERLFSRVESIADFRQDGSFRGRVDIAERGIWLVANAPQGYGLGSSGMAGRISGSAGVIGDSGVLELLTTFGLPGLLLLTLWIRPFFVDAVAIHRRARREQAALGLAQLVGGMSAMAFANWLTVGSAGIALVVLGAVVAQGVPRPVTAKSAHRASGVVRWG